MLRKTLPLAAAAALALAGCKQQKRTTPAALTTCVGCHGAADNAAPPASTTGATATADPAVGAHQTHLNPGAFRKAVACAECHPVPLGVDSPGHLDGVVQVQFGLIAGAGLRGSGAGAVNAVPTWNPSTLTCSAVYCHGATLEADPVTGAPSAGAGALKSPTWTVVKGDPAAAGSQVFCGSCHAIPPPAPKHPDIAAYAGSDSPGQLRWPSCHACHPGTVQADGTLDIAGGQHIDGVMQIGAAACTRCHGDQARSGDIALTPAPPVGAHDPAGAGGATSTSNVGVGAHQAHLAGTSLSSVPIACGECHLVPTSMLAHPNPAYNLAAHAGPVDVTWGPLATAGGVVPRWDKTTAPAAPTCSSTYCHGGTLSGGSNTAPVWTQVGSGQAACGTCHGVPPADSAHLSLPTGSACGACHVGYGGQIGDALNTFTAASLNRATHIDGNINVGSGLLATCTGCHGDSARGQVWLQPAPPTDLSCIPGTAFPCTTSLVGVGAHQAHLTQTSLAAAAVGCIECHAPVTRSDHSSGTGRVVNLTFGPMATANGAAPAWNGPARTSDQFPGRVSPGNPGPDACLGGYCTCATTYCHGATLEGGTTDATNPGAGKNKSPVWTQVGAGQARCGTCHGIPPPLPHTGNLDCGTCHTGYTSTTVNLALHIDGKVDATGGSCTSCHGDPSRTPSAIAAAPPSIASLAGTGTPPWASGDPGAHLKHLAGTVLRSAPIPCSECHAVPTGPPMGPGSGDSHGDGAATVAFGTLARVGSASPSWTEATLTCAATYCHGGANPAWGGTATAPVWSVLDGRYGACGSCHANPPSTTSQGGQHPDVAAAQNCNGCHPGYNGVKGGTIAVNVTLHLNGSVDYTTGTASCASCHGDPTRRPAAGQDALLAAAPPAIAHPGAAAPPWNATDPGAHQAHLVNTTWRSAPLACNDCHVVPTAWNATGTTHRDGTADVTFGSLARTSGLVPTWIAATVTCAATYCHGDGMAVGVAGTVTRPTWNGGPAQSACGTCHASPPTDATHAGVTTACTPCHDAAYSSTTVNKALHLNGTIDANLGSCSSCHGNPARVLVTGADPQVASAPPAVAVAGSYAADAGVGASATAREKDNPHSRHLNQSAAAPISAPIACSECHTIPASSGAVGVHRNSAADIAFGTLAKTNGAAPVALAVGPAGAAPSCAATYCHGGTMQGGNRTSPSWGIDASAAACTACHGMPPTTVARGARSHPASTGTDCGSCHTGYTATAVNLALHVNGTVDATVSCTSCHGNSARVLASGADPQTRSAPPQLAGNAGSPWWTADLLADPTPVASNPEIGLHARHLDRTTGAIGAHVKCAECHLVPSGPPAGGADTHGSGTASVALGTVSRTKTGTTAPAPTWTAGTVTCAATYCHGNFTYTPAGTTTPNPNSRGVNYDGSAAGTGTMPRWNIASPSPLACGACHFIPAGNPANNPMPNDSCHPKTASNTGGFNHSGGNSCQSCHKNASGSATGTATITNAATHVDGVLNGKCTDCHAKDGNGAPWPCKT